MSRNPLAFILVFGVVLAGCADAPPPRHPMRYYAPAPVQPVERVAEVIAYPARGQTPEQLDRDRYECHRWAVQQTGFDPSAQPAAVPPPPRAAELPPPGSGTAAGAVTGAILGAIVARPGREGGGAVIGAITGAAVGNAAETSARADAERADAYAAASQGARDAGRGGAYRRAMSACLEGRGYTVK
jgi:hypothetical protein